MRFADPIYLYLLLTIPIIAIVRYWVARQRRKRLRLFAQPEMMKKLSVDVSRVRPEVKFWLLQTVLLLLILMLARPQLGTRITHEKRKGIETIIAMDISNSMLANDVEPSRLDRAKMMVSNMVDHFTDDKIGLIVFAGDAFVQLPITSDYVSAKMFMSNITPSLIAVQGTDIALAIRNATNSFTNQQGIGKAIVVITDGEDHEGGAMEAAKEAKKKGMRVYVLGIGSTKGAPIPRPDGNGYMQDNTGNTVMSALNEQMCRQIAEAGGGAYIHVENNSNAQQQLEDQLDKLAKQETMSTIYSDFDEQFQAFAILAILMLIIEIFVLERQNQMIGRMRFFQRKGKTTIMVIMLMAMASTTALAQSDRLEIRKGNKEFRAGNNQQAEVAYRKSIERNKANAEAHFNLGNALLAQGKDSAAIEEYQTAADLQKVPMRKAQIYHNIGVVCQSKKLYQDAINHYKKALRLNPHDNMTRYNLELCKREAKKQQQNQQNQQNKQNKQDKDKQNKDQKDKQKQQKQNEDKQKEQQERNKMSRDNAEQLLNAAIQQEKNTNDKIKKAMRQPASRKLEKNW